MPEGVIVVGVDGTEHSRRALVWASQEAARRDATLHVVHVWHDPIPGFPMEGLPATGLLEARRRILDAAVVTAGQYTDKVDSTLAGGDPTHELVAISKEADLLVVGSRGHGIIAEALLGSVSSGCAHDATCPVVIIPPGFSPDR
jgi:nucleotide-binding universal stress UspA family protein